MKKKTKVIAAIERGGLTVAKVINDTTAQTIEKFLHTNIEKGSTLMTDMSNRYRTSGYERETVNHGAKRWVSGNAHVNNVESFWSHLKRSIKGTHKSVSKEHFQSYLDAFVWLRNNRDNDRERFFALLGAIVR